MVQETLPKITILATIVLYNESLETSDTWQTLFQTAPASVSWLVINNGPSSISLPDNFVGEYYEDLSNAGLAVAYKKALLYAEEKSFSHLLFLDQDTTFPVDFWERQKKVLDENGEYSLYLPTIYGERFMLSPCGFKHGLGRAITKKELPSVVTFKEYSFINSGALFVVKDLSEVWSDTITGLFLDNIDHAIAHYLHLHHKKSIWFEADIRQSYSGDCTDKEQVLKRLNGWVGDAKVFGKITNTSFWQGIWILRRRLRLFLDYWDWRFLR